MRICLLTTQDLDASPFADEDWPCDPRPFLPDDEWHVATLVGKHESVAQVERLIEKGFDLYFNLCDGAADQKIPGIEVIETLEKHGVPFVGATSECYEPSRIRMKEVCQELAIATPAHVLARNEKDLERAAKTLRFAFCQALQQLRIHRSEPALARSDARWLADPGQEDHVASRSCPGRGIHRWHRVHGARC